MVFSVTIYLLTFLTSIAFCKIYKRIKSKKIMTILIILPAVLIAALRYNVGMDYKNYYDLFYYIGRHIHSFNEILAYYIEPLYVVINVICFKITGSFPILLFVLEFIFCYYIIKTIVYYSNEYGISIALAYFIFLITLYHFSYNGIRQAIAVAIIFSGYKYIFNKQFKKYILIVILASLFHTSALLCVFLYFVWNKNCSNNQKKYYTLVIISTVLMPMIFLGIKIIIEKFNIYKYYLSLNTNISFGFLLYLLPVVFILLLNRKNTEINELYLFMSRLFVLQFPLQMLGNLIKYSDRLALYVVPSQFVLLPIFIKNSKDNKKSKLLLVICWYIFYYSIMYIYLNSNGVYPYNWII